MYDDEAERIIELASQVPYKPAWMIQEELGSERSVRRIQEIINARLGRRPTKATIERGDFLRDGVAAYMVSQGLDERYCSNCMKRSLLKCAIHRLGPDIDSWVFVCRHCAAPGDR
jgi:hypothetical protein